MTKINTTVKNISRSSYALFICRGINQTLKAGEVAKYDFDIWSKVDRTTQRRLERDLNKGIITIDTVMLTDNGKAITEKAGNINIADAPKPEEPKAKPAPAVNKAAPEEAIKKAGVQLAGHTATTEVNKDITKLGIKVAEDQTRDVKDSLKNQIDNRGFTKLAEDTSKVKLNNVFGDNKANVEQVKTTGLWNKQEAITEVQPAPAEKAPKKPSLKDEFNSLFTAKDYTAIYDKCKVVWPEAKVKKTDIKDCNNIDELLTKCGLTLPS